MTNVRIRELARKYTEHDMIQTYTDLPDYPDYRVRLLYAFLSKGTEVTNDYSELYALVTSLVQMGLDTHDLVDVPPFKVETVQYEARSRQLKVLAGDYFSSRFYHLLSQAGQIDMVRHLSDAICEVNRLKMNLYMRMKQLKLTAEEYIMQTVRIKMQLFLPFSRHMEGNYLLAWPDILQSLTACEVLSQELGRTYTLNHHRRGWAYWHLMHLSTREEKKVLHDEMPDSDQMESLIVKYDARPLLCHKLEVQLKQAIEKVEQFDSDKVIQELRQIVSPFMRCLSTPKVLEEI